MMENNVRFFQWVAGEQKGQIKIFDKIEPDGAELFIVFKDGSRINESLVSPLNMTDLTGKFMAEIDNPSNCWTFKDEWVGRTEETWIEQDETNPGNKVCVDPGNPGVKVVKLIPPRPTPKTHSSFGTINTPTKPAEHLLENNNAQVESPATDKKTTIDVNDPIYILISKSKKEDSDIMMELTVSLPPKSLYDIAKTSFEEGDRKFVEYIIENMAVDHLKEAIKNAITNMYEKIEITNVSLK